MCLRWAVMYPVPWSEEAGHCAGIATGAGMRVSGDRKVLLPGGEPLNCCLCDDLTPDRKCQGTLR